jgi:hypothetical protein
VEISHSAEELAGKIADFISANPSVKKMIVKLNYGIYLLSIISKYLFPHSLLKGFGGQGNAFLELSHLAQSGQKITEVCLCIDYRSYYTPYAWS